MRKTLVVAVAARRRGRSAGVGCQSRPEGAARLHLGRLHQARGGDPLRAAERVQGRHRHLRLQRGDVRQAQGRRHRLRPHHAVELHGAGHARPGDAAAARPRASCRTSPTSTGSSSGSPSTRTMHHSVPYMLTVTGLAYLQSKVRDFTPTWAMLDRADLAGRMTMLNDMRETMGAALKFLGYSINSTDEARARRRRATSCIRWKKNLAKFENEQYKTGLASGEFLLVHGYSGDILQVQGENEDIVFAVPAGGDLVRLRRPGDPQGRAQRRPGAPLHQLPPRPQGGRREHRVHQLPLPQRGELPAAVRGDPRQPGDVPPPRGAAPAARSSSTSAPTTPRTSRAWDEIKASGSASRPSRAQLQALHARRKPLTVNFFPSRSAPGGLLRDRSAVLDAGLQLGGLWEELERGLKLVVGLGQDPGALGERDPRDS